jgi:hypothetical protein
MTMILEERDLDLAENLRRLIDEGWPIQLECSNKAEATMMKKLVDRPGRIFTSTIKFHVKEAA